jgi:hypothetical protein
MITYTYAGFKCIQTKDGTTHIYGTENDGTEVEVDCIEEDDREEVQEYIKKHIL